MTIEALPVRSTYQPDEHPQIEIRGLPEPGTLHVFHLGDQVDVRSIEADGIAFFEDRAGSGINLNLTIEVGSMLMTGRRVALLKDATVEALPTDLVGKIYKSVNLEKLSTVRSGVHAWLAEDLSLGTCSICGS